MSSVGEWRKGSASAGEWRLWVGDRKVGTVFRYDGAGPAVWVAEWGQGQEEEAATVPDAMSLVERATGVTVGTRAVWVESTAGRSDGFRLLVNDRQFGEVRVDGDTGKWEAVWSQSGPVAAASPGEAAMLVEAAAGVSGAACRVQIKPGVVGEWGVWDAAGSARTFSRNGMPFGFLAPADPFGFPEPDFKYTAWRLRYGADGDEYRGRFRTQGRAMAFLESDAYLAQPQHGPVEWVGGFGIAAGGGEEESVLVAGGVAVGSVYKDTGLNEWVANWGLDRSGVQSVEAAKALVEARTGLRPGPAKPFEGPESFLTAKLSGGLGFGQRQVAYWKHGACYFVRLSPQPFGYVEERNGEYVAYRNLDSDVEANPELGRKGTLEGAMKLVERDTACHIFNTQPDLIRAAELATEFVNAVG